MDRRRFFSSAAGVVAAFQFDSVARAQRATRAISGRPADAVARDEDFWFNIREAFTVDRTLINLNNGGVSPAPRIVMEDGAVFNGSVEPARIEAALRVAAYRRKA